jgi:hypothetical protein
LRVLDAMREHRVLHEKRFREELRRVIHEGRRRRTRS